MESGGNNRLLSRGVDSGSVSGGSGRNSREGSGLQQSTSHSSGVSNSSSRSSTGNTAGGIIVATSGAGGLSPAPGSSGEWEMFQFGKYPMDILEVLSGHQAHQFKGLGLERQLQHQQQVQLHQHQQQLQQQQQQQHSETSGTLLSGIGLGSLQGSRSNAFTDSSSIFAKMSAPAPSIQQAQPASSQSSRKSNKTTSATAGSGSGGTVAGYSQFLRTFHPSEAALAQEQLHSGMGRFEHYAGGSVTGGASMIGGVVTSGPPPLPPPLHPGLSVPQASPGPSSSSPSPNSTSTANNPPSSTAVVSLGQQLVGGQSDARSLHQQFSCMLAANQYFLSGVPPNASLEQFLVQQGTHNHLGLGLSQGGTDSNSGLAPPPALHPSHTHGHATSQQQQQIPPHALPHPHSHPHSHHPLHPATQPSTLGSFDFQGIPVLSSNQLASLMQQETGLPIHLPLHLSISKEEGKDNVANTSGNGGGGRRKKAMAGYLPQRKSESNNSNSSNCHSSGDSNTSNHTRGNGHNAASGGGGVDMSSLGEDHSSLLRSTSSSSTSAVASSSSSSAPLSASSSVPVINVSQISKPDSLNPVAPAVNQPEPEPLYHCGECGKTFTHLSSLRRHLRSHGLSSARSVTGNNVPDSIQSHTQHHPSDSALPHSTQEAAPQSAPHQQLQQQAVETLQQQSNCAPTSSSSCPSPDKAHCCTECGKRFKKRGHLLQHGVIHSGARPFSCSICQRSFNRRESLTRHEKIHEEKPFRCPACGRCFRESTSLLNHAASATCGKPGRRSRNRRANGGSSNSLAVGGNESFGLKNSKAGLIATGNEEGNYQGGQLSSEGLVYDKTEDEEERGVVNCIIGVNDEDVEKAGLSCGSLFQQRRQSDTINRNKTEGKYGSEFSRNRYHVSYRNDDCHADYKEHRSQTNSSCCSSGSSCDNKTVGPALKKAPLAPTLLPHPQSQIQHHQQQQQAHLPLSSLLDDSEDDVTSSVNSSMSAIAATAAVSCMPGEHNDVGGIGEERRDIIGGLLGGLGFGSLGVSPNGSSTSSAVDKVFRRSANEDCLGSTMMNLTQQSQQQPHQQILTVKPKRPRKPRPKKEPRPAGIGSDGSKRKRQSRVAENGTERPYLCSVCGRGFSRRETLRRHDRIHTGEKPYHCSVCGKDFREAFHLTKHRTVHSGEKNYKCTLCGKDFGYAQSLKRHGKLHQKGDIGDRASAAITNACNSNNVSTPTPEGSISHVTDQVNSYYYSHDKSQGSHTQPPPRLYTCSICWKSFRHNFHLTAHQQTVHGNGEKPYSCEVCGKAFAYSNSLTRHRLSQHGLTRTGQANVPRGGNGSAARQSSAVSEREVPTNALHLVPPTGTHEGHQTHANVCHTQHPASLPPSSSLSPLFYLPESGASNSHVSVSHASQNHSTINHSHPQLTTVKGESIYQANPASLLTHSPFFMTGSQQQQHQSQLVVDLKTCSDGHRDYQSEAFVRKHKSNKMKDSNVARAQMGESSNGRCCFAQNRHLNNTAKLQKRKKIHQQLLKKKLAWFLHMREGRKAWHRVGLSFRYGSSLEASQKRFPCPYCPCTTFFQQARLLVHRARRHPPCSQRVRLECLACGRHSHKLLEVLRHRGFHLAQGSFTCPRCRSRFWNGVLLRRHKVACRGIRKDGRYSSLKPFSVSRAAENKGEGQNNRTEVLVDCRF